MNKINHSTIIKEVGISDMHEVQKQREDELEQKKKQH